ncbi:hypothetical protein AC1031_015036 [Aphanomyces cochlioides]|nr:hypothetical protein AC1031_015036 [Aphanomyces cochlioides]
MLRFASNHFHGLKDIVVICDNAPCHSRVEQVFEEDEFVEVPFCALAHIHHNSIQLRICGLKSSLASRHSFEKMTLDEFRLQYHENCAERALSGTVMLVSMSSRYVEIDPLRNDRFTNRLDWFYGLAQDLADMPIGA